jgi:hypothetical protein
LTLGEEEVKSFIRLSVQKDTGNDFWLDVEVNADTSLAPNNTIASGVVDIFYDETELTPESADYGFLSGEGGYGLYSLDELVDADGYSVRLQFTSDGVPGTFPFGGPGYDLDSDWELLATVYFSRTPPKHDDGTRIRVRSLHLGFYDSPGNENESDRVVNSVVEIQ